MVNIKYDTVYFLFRKSARFANICVCAKIEQRDISYTLLFSSKEGLCIQGKIVTSFYCKKLILRYSPTSFIFSKSSSYDGPRVVRNIFCW